MPERMTRTPEMREFIDMLNKSEFKRDLHSKIEENRITVTEQYLTIRKQQEEDSHVTLINGDKRRVKTNVAVAKMYDDVREIRASTRWLTKPKVIIAVIIFIISQVFVFGVWKGTVDANMNNVKEIMADIKEDAHTNTKDIKEILKNTRK